MLNEEISKEAVGQATRAAEDEVMKPITHFMTGHFVRPTADMLVDDLKRAVAAPGVAIKDTFHPEHGEMKVRDLIRKDEGAQAIDIDGAGLRDFKRIANKYGLDFAIVKSTELDPPKYSVFFKARDADAIQAVVNEYTVRQMKIQKEGRPSILAKLSKFKNIVAALPKKVAEKRKEQER